LIFVTVGLHYQPFDRLVKAADAIAPSLREDVIIQRGVSRYVPRHCKSEAFYDSATYEKLESDCTILVAHAGAGTILDAIDRQKKLVLMPRMRKYGEHNNNHQVELAEKLAGLGLARVAMDTDSLLRCLRSEEQSWSSASHHPHGTELRARLTSWIDEYSRRRLSPRPQR